MANSIILKKSSVPAKVPLVGDLQYGELALNYADGKLYYKKSDGTTIDYFSSGAGSSAAISVGVAPPSSPTAGSLWWDSTYGTLKIYYNDGTSSQWVDASSGAAGGGGGSGDMLKSVYDTTNNGKVDTAEYAETAPWTGISGKPATFPPSTHTHVSADITDLSTTISSAITDHTNAADPHPQYATLAEVAAVSGDLHGIVDRTASTLSFNDGTRTLTITPVSGSWTFYDHGTLYTVSSAKSITIANTAGARFIRIDPATLNLVEGGSVPDFANDVIIAYVYWDTTGSKALIVGDERHGSKRDTTWHSAQHLNVGTVWRSGGALSYTLNNASSVQIGVGTPLLIADEDLLHTISHSAAPSADYQQILNTAASVQVLYLSGTSYTSTTASTTPWIAGTSLARYNLVSGGSGSLVDATEGSYITYWLLATNDIRSPVKLVLGRAAHATLDAAYAETFEEYGLSFAEQVFMQQIVVQTSSAYSANAAKIVVAGVRKVLSKVATSAATVSATEHNNLTGRDIADAHPISSITGLSSALSGKQDTLISGTNIKTINGTSLIGAGNFSVGTVTSVAGTGSVSGLTLSGTVTSSGNITLGGSLDLSSPPAIGGTTPAAINGTTISATASITAASNEGAFSYGTLTYSTAANLFASYQTSVNAYAQLIVQNSSSGTSASSDIIVNNNLSTDTTYYGDFGMNSSTWTGVIGTNSLSAPNVAYLSSTSVDLVIGTTTANSIRFVTNSGADVLSITPLGGFAMAGVATGYGTAGQVLTSNGNAPPTWQTVTGGTGSPGGSTNQLQYNAGGGAFGGSAALTFDPATNSLSLLGTDTDIILNGITNEPAAPSAGTLAIYAKSIAGRMVPKWVGPSGFDTPFQASFAHNKMGWWNPPGNATTVPGVVGFTAPTAIGTATARTVATTNVFTRARRLGYNSATTAGAAGGHYVATAQYTIGTGTVGVGGFFYVCRFGSADTLAQAIMFVGMSSSVATPTVTASPATFTNSIGVGCATGDTNLSLYYGGSAAQTPIALGASFPAKTNSTDLYELVLFAPSNANNTVSYRVTNLTTNVQVSGTLTAATPGTQLPSSTTLLAHRAYRSNNATAAGVLIDVVSVYIETDT